MGEAAKRIATYADIEALPSNLVGELIGGELYTMSRPSPKHAIAGSNLLTWSNTRFGFGDGGPGGWLIMMEPELHLRADVLVPDIAGWKRTRMPELPDEAHITTVPDWVCEVLSPSTQRHDRAKKMTRYAIHGVPYAWLIDPLAKLLEVFQLNGDVWTRIAVFEENDMVRAAPFQEVELSLGLLWPSGAAL